MKKSLKITTIVALCIVALLLFVFLFGSLFGGCAVKHYVNRQVPELIGRQTHVDHVGINLFTGRVAVHGLAVYEEDDSTLFAGFDTLDVALSLLRLAGKRVYVRHFTLAGLDARVAQDSARFNFSSIIERFQKDSTEVDTPEDTTPSDWRVSLHRIHISRGRLSYEDLPRQSHIRLRHLNLTVPDFAFGGSERTDADLTVALAEGGVLTANGNYDSESGEFDINLALEHLALNQALPYMANRAYIEEIRGYVDLYAKSHGNMNHIMDMEISAKSHIIDADIIDNQQQSVASLKRSDIEIGRIVISQRLYDINSISLDGLTAAYELFADSTNTISRLLMPEITDSAALNMPNDSADIDTVPDNLPPLKAHVGLLTMQNINFTYADHTMPVDFLFPITDITVESRNLTTSGNNNARIRATLPHGGSAVVDWSGNITDWKLNQSLKLNIRGLHLTDLSPYMITYFGMPFSDGIFTFTSNNTITNSRLEGKNTIDIYRPSLGKRQQQVKPRLRLPVKAALYVLKDKDNKVLLDVPVSGNVDSPDFHYMKLVWKTLGNLIVKVATSPARLLGSAMGSDDDELFIAIDPKQEDFTSEQFYQIDKIAELAKNDENIVLNFRLLTRPGHEESETPKHLNKMLHSHLKHLGIKESQFTVSTADPDSETKQEGYEVTAEVFEN